ncbi:helix-turn-helix domain-containing protein [Nocardiopsis algeriensis]|uniref:Transcriptional regulator with XRE-family HTH domain n=1 Tax=Nocardiopsis algeriensis TaxID=1478215 RepID=A0A841ISP1_9ACTN|nr:helix-turn-helix transcriptional regulator [Nocardiopsis algeriensis]MBB6121240.1 transcriptional regulator with XRE-family HTH domain [Nocardiopsis algeriensis]
MQRPHSPTLRRRRLSAELKRARARAKLTTTQAIKSLGWAAGKLSQIENAETQKVKPDDLDKMLDLYEIKDPAKREALHALARDAKVRGWWSKYKEVFGPQSLPDFEAEASAIRTFEGLVVPGLLQTPDYAQAVIQGGRYTSAEEVERRVKARMERRDILTRFKPASLRVILDEAVLHRVIGSPPVMAEQLRHLLHMAKLPNIDLQVVPFAAGAHAAFVAPFSILDFPDPLDAPIVFVDTASGGLFLEESDEVESHIVTFGDVQGSAMSASQSARLITEVLKTLESKS